MDFSRLGSTKEAQAPTDPIRIFEALPSLSGTFNDLWRGQDKALTKWHLARKNQDVLVSLNTGAGKTIVGLLIAQSLVNEGLQNVVYVCSTIDLVQQTSEEANRIGIDHSIRVRGAFSNDLFETGKAFCITTYAALFNGHSALRARFFPQAIIFDDAHVAESLLRDAFTLRIDIYEQKELFNEIAELFKPHFHELGIAGKFRDALEISRFSTAFVAPHGLYERRDRLLQLLLQYRIKDHERLTYPFAWLEDHISACAATFSNGIFELTPPFLPSLALDIFQQKVRRVYLSATLQSQTDFIRAFGRSPNVTITPSNDAGNGERLIISGRKIKGGFGPTFATHLVQNKKKVVIAVPDYGRATPWSDVAEPPERGAFSEKLDKFRNAQKGAFILVSRVDGIDLPHDACRLMIMDGLPSGTSQLERYQWEFLRMNNVHAVRMANRLAQLFGRINRGRNDYGAFLVQGDDLDKWLSNDRNLTLLPPLLQKQILIGREVQKAFEINTAEQANELINRVLNRDEGWLDYYQREVKLAELDKDQLDRYNVAEPFMVLAALSEAKYAAAMWNNDPMTARRELEKTVDTTAQHDTPLGGWHALWLGAAFELEGDKEAARVAYGHAMQRLGSAITLPRPVVKSVKKKVPELNAFGRSLRGLLNYTHGNKFEMEMNKLRQVLAMIDEGGPNQAEAGVRALGELLGFMSNRPDNDLGTGPDVLWLDETNQLQLGFELKTDKNDPATYFKKDISQAHDHLSWMSNINQNSKILGLIFIGPHGSVHTQANPTKDMSLCLTHKVAALRDEVLALIEDLRRRTPVERIIAIGEETERDKWLLESLFCRLDPQPLLN